MASRRDLFQSYQFMVQRVISGMVQRETDPIQTPLRKMIGSAFAGVMIAVVGMAGAGLIGVFFGVDSKEWQNSSVVIVEKETGANFVWLPDRAAGQNLLFPTANFASAALLVNSIEVVEVSRASLLPAPRGPRLGIVDGPDSLPDAERMLGGPWTLCSLPAESRDGRSVPNTALVVGRNISQGQLIEDSAVLVRDIDADPNLLYLVANGHRYFIPDEDVVLEALSLVDVTPIEVGTAWLDALPAGLDLTPDPVAERGATSTVLAGAIVGEVVYTESANDVQYYEVTPNQLEEITEVQSLILLADPAIVDTVYAGRTPVARLIPSGLVTDIGDDRRIPLPPQLPTDPPAEQPAMFPYEAQNPTICGSFAEDAQTPEIAVEAAVAGTEDAIATQSRTGGGTVLADRVLVDPGHGTIVEEMASGSAVVGIRYLVTDEGRRYRISPEVQEMLGYGEERVALPASLIARVPAGGALDPRAAGATVG